MKIAMIGLRGIPAKSGGVEVAVENLAPRLVKLGAKVTVYCRNHYSKYNPETFKGVKLKYLPTINKKHTEALVHSLLSTSNAIFRDYDIIHYHALANSIFSIAPRITGKKTVVTIHGLDYEREKWGKASRIYLRLCAYLNRFFPNSVISVSGKIKDLYKEKYNKEIVYIPNGVSIEKPLPLKKLKRFNIEKQGYFLFLSRLVPEKGAHILIGAFKEIETNKKLLIVGDGVHTDDYVKKIKEAAKADKRIIFTGALYGEEKNEAYSNAYAFILPSTIEGMPIVLLEAMSYGLCPIVSNIKENMDVSPYRISFRSKNKDSLKQKLEFALNNPKLISKVGTSAKGFVKKEYDWDAIAKKTFCLYKGVLK